MWSALDSCVRLASVLHAAPVPAPLFFPKGRGLNSVPSGTDRLPVVDRTLDDAHLEGSGSLRN